MVPLTYNPVLYQGDTWNVQVSLSQLVSGSYTSYSLTNFSAKSQLRKRPESDYVAFEFTCAISGANIYLSAAPSATATIPAGAYAWDLQISCTSGTDSGSLYTVAAGRAAVIAEVTR